MAILVSDTRRKSLHVFYGRGLGEFGGAAQGSLQLSVARNGDAAGGVKPGVLEGAPQMAKAPRRTLQAETHWEQD